MSKKNHQKYLKKLAGKSFKMVGKCHKTESFKCKEKMCQ